MTGSECHTGTMMTTGSQGPPLQMATTQAGRKVTHADDDGNIVGSQGPYTDDDDDMTMHTGSPHADDDAWDMNNMAYGASIPWPAW